MFSTSVLLCPSNLSTFIKFYAHREKMRLIGREDDLEKINRKALKIAREVADKTGTLMAGNVACSTIYDPNNEETKQEIKDMYRVSD